MPNQTAGKHTHREKMVLWVLCFFFFSNDFDSLLSRHNQPNIVVAIFCSFLCDLCVHMHTIETIGIYCEQECHVLIQGTISLYLNLLLGYQYYNHMQKRKYCFLSSKPYPSTRHIPPLDKLECFLLLRGTRSNIRPRQKTHLGH